MEELKEMVGPQLASQCMVVEELIMVEQQFAPWALYFPCLVNSTLRDHVNESARQNYKLVGFAAKFFGMVSLKNPSGNPDWVYAIFCEEINFSRAFNTTVL